MTLGQPGNRIAIELAERMPDGLPRAGDFQIAVSAETRCFVGSGLAWLDADGYAAFVDAFAGLVNSRTGEAILRGMSPGDFELVFRAVDTIGHVTMSGRLRSRQQGSHSRLCNGFEFEIELDGEYLEQYGRDFKHLRSAG